MIGAFYYTRYEMMQNHKTNLDLLLLASLSESESILFFSHESHWIGHDTSMSMEGLYFNEIPNRIKEPDRSLECYLEVTFNETFGLYGCPVRPSLEGSSDELTANDFTRIIGACIKDRDREMKLSRLMDNATRRVQLYKIFTPSSGEFPIIHTNYHTTEEYQAIPHVWRKRPTLNEFQGLVLKSLDKIVELSKK
ncbi:MAG: hypothetical protein V1743_01150 [Nanoarchaeota archaeon]